MKQLLFSQINKAGIIEPIYLQRRRNPQSKFIFFASRVIKAIYYYNAFPDRSIIFLKPQNQQ